MEKTDLTSVEGMFSRQLEQKWDSISCVTQNPQRSLGQWRQKKSLLIGFRMPQEHAYLTGLGCMKLILDDAEFLLVSL